MLRDNRKKGGRGQKAKKEEWEGREKKRETDTEISGENRNFRDPVAGSRSHYSTLKGILGCPRAEPPEQLFGIQILMVVTEMKN